MKEGKIMAPLAIAIIALPLTLSYTHHSTEVVTGDESTVYPPPPPIRQHPSAPSSNSPIPRAPLPPTQWARRALLGRVYSVTFSTHWFFCALLDPLSRLPQPAERGKIIHQRPLRWETIYRPPTQGHGSTNTHTKTHRKKTHADTQTYMHKYMQERKRASKPNCTINKRFVQQGKNTGQV